MDPPGGGQRSSDRQDNPYREWTLCLTAPFLGLRYPVDSIAGHQPNISIYKVRRSAVRKLIPLIFQVLLMGYKNWPFCKANLVKMARKCLKMYGSVHLRNFFNLTLPKHVFFRGETLVSGRNGPRRKAFFMPKRDPFVRQNVKMAHP